MGPLFLFFALLIFFVKKKLFFILFLFFFFFLFSQEKKFLLFFFLVFLSNMFYCWHWFQSLSADDVGRDSWDWVGPPAWGRA